QDFLDRFAHCLGYLVGIAIPQKPDHRLLFRISPDKVIEGRITGNRAGVPLGADPFAPEVERKVLDSTGAGDQILAGTDGIGGIFTGHYDPAWNSTPAFELCLSCCSAL